MEEKSPKELRNLLIQLTSDGFNRSLGALDEAGAIDLTELGQHYREIGSRSYDIVTEQMELTADHGIESIQAVFKNSQPPA